MENEQEKVYKGYSCSGLCCTKIENFGVTIGSTKILEDINIHIHCGELTAVIGPNGAGKSTLLKAILGDVKHSGKLSFLDEKGILLKDDNSEFAFWKSLIFIEYQSFISSSSTLRATFGIARLSGENAL